jgi:hypothetical protein
MITASTYLRLHGRIWRYWTLTRATKVRYSLRELLLFMLVCGAFLGWSQAVRRKSLPFQPTHIAQHFVDEFGNEVAEIAASLGEEGAVVAFAKLDDEKQLTAAVQGKEQIRLGWDFDLQVPLERAYRLRQELIRRAIDQIKQARAGDIAGCVENLSDMRLRAKDPDLPPQSDSRYLGHRQTGILGFWEDEIDYRCGDVDGQLRFSIVAIESKSVRLMARGHEWHVR